MEISTYSVLKELIIEPKNHCPRVILDKISGRFEISGISIPDNVNAIYIPVIKWFEFYAQMPNAKTEISFKLDFICQQSFEMISRIMEIFQKIHNSGKIIHVNWYYHIDGEDMRIEGRHFANTFTFPIELINYRE